MASAGGLFGFLLIIVGVPALARRLPADVPRVAEIAVDWRVVVFTTAVSILTGVLFGLVPLYHSRRVSPNDSLKEGGRAIVMDQSRLRSFLIVGQVAIAMILLVGAGLMTKSLWKLTRVVPGFQTEHIHHLEMVP